MYATVTRTFEDGREYCFAASDYPLPDGSFAKTNEPSETREVFIHRALSGMPESDWRTLRPGVRIRIRKIVIANGRGLRAEGVAVVV